MTPTTVIAERGERRPATTERTPAELIELVLEKGEGIDQLAKLMELKERWEAREAEKQFIAALQAFKANPPKIVKNAVLEHFGGGKGKKPSMYASADHVAGILQPALARHGLTYRWESAEAPGGLVRITCVLTHSGGHSERTSLVAAADGSGGKTGPQQVGSTVTYLQRYTLLAATGIVVQGADDDGRGGAKAGDRITDEQAETLKLLMDETRTDAGKFFELFGIDDLAELSRANFDVAMRMLKKKAGGR